MPTALIVTIDIKVNGVVLMRDLPMIPMEFSSGGVGRNLSLRIPNLAGDVVQFGANASVIGSAHRDAKGNKPEVPGWTAAQKAAWLDRANGFVPTGLPVKSEDAES